MAKKQSLRERMIARREQLNDKGGNYSLFLFTKPGSYRHRHVPVGAENDWAIEVVYIYLNKELGGVISPRTFGEKCALTDAYEELKNSKDEADRNFSAKLKPKKRYLSLSVRYKDDKGKEIDTENGVKLTMLTGDSYQGMIDLWLDDESGDFTDPINGYDVKHKRVGTGQFDTKYTVTRCNPSKLPKEFRGPYNLEEMVRKEIPTYKATKVLLEKFLNIASEEEEEPKESTATTKKKKKTRDI